jgi:hypothetical protein
MFWKNLGFFILKVCSVLFCSVRRRRQWSWWITAKDIQYDTVHEVVNDNDDDCWRQYDDMTIWRWWWWWWWLRLHDEQEEVPFRYWIWLYCCVLLFFFLLNNTEYSIIMLFADGFSILYYLFSLNFCYSTMHKGR